MKPKHLFTSLLAVTALFVASCSTSRMGQNTAIQDDVYNSNARATEIVALAPLQNNRLPVDSIGETSFDYGKNDPYYDMSYASRIDRFYYGDRWRSYFDNYYDAFGYNNFYGSFGLGMDRFYNYGNPYGFGGYYPYSFSLGWGGYFGSFYNSWSPWGFYGNYWGPYSYNPYFGGGFYGGGYYGGGYYGGGGGYVVRGRDNNPRPSRGNDNGVYRPGTGSYVGGTASRGDNRSYGGTRAESYNPSNSSGRPSRGGEIGNATRPTESGRPTRTNDMPIGSRPSRGDVAPSTAPSSSRPSRGNDSPPPSRPTYNPPPTQSAPPPSSSGGGSSRGGGSSGGGGRPTRG